jgi:UDP-N-acetylmuramate dehydrogenase
MQQNISLQPYNTFHIQAVARWFIHFNKREELISFLENELDSYKHFFILGGGSNVLFADNFDGLVIHVDLEGRSIEYEDSEEVHLRVMAGEDWDHLVDYTVNHGWGGLENLSLIPGKTGASPIQNIGAYGVEVKDVILEVEYFDLEAKQIHRLNNQQCMFSYRNSIFKSDLKGKVVILSVLIRLNKKPVLNYNYITLQNELVSTDEINIKSIRDAVIRVRQRRLPDPEVLGNAGSFFKNPVVPAVQYQNLKKDDKDLPGFEVDVNAVKIPAAYLIEKCNWKGRRMGNVGVHQHQPLVLVHYGNGKGWEILQLAEQIKASVKLKFDIELDMEVNLVRND